jgi:hypothetical protein
MNNKVYGFKKYAELWMQFKEAGDDLPYFAILPRIGPVLCQDGKILFHPFESGEGTYWESKETNNKDL